VAQIYPQALGSPFIASYDWQGYGGGILPRLHTGLGSGVLTAVVMKDFIFWDITPYRQLKVNRRFGGTYRFHIKDPRMSRRLCLSPAFTLVFLLGFHSSTLNMKAIRSSETSVDFQLSICSYIPEDRTFHV
jgi:hypothetical protein